MFGINLFYRCNHLSDTPLLTLVEKNHGVTLKTHQLTTKEEAQNAHTKRSNRVEVIKPLIVL